MGQFFWDSDLDHYDREAFLIVIGYNGKNHYCLTQKMSGGELNAWKVYNMVMHLQAASIEFDNIHEDLLTDDAQQQLHNLKGAVNLGIDQFDEEVKYTTNDACARLSEKCQPFCHFPGVKNVLSLDPSLHHPSLPTSTTPSAPVSSKPPPAPPGKGKKKYKCPHCPMTFPEHDAKEDHVRNVHRKQHLCCQQCNIPFKYLKGFREHQKSFHGGGYTYKCRFAPPHPDGCTFKGTNSTQ